MRGYTLVCILSYHSLTNKMDKKQKVKKIIQIIWNIVSIIFVTFISGALIINAIKGADEKTQDIVTPNIQEVKHRENAVTYGGYSLCSFADICNFDYLFYNYDGSGFFTATSQGTIKTAYELTNPDKVRFIGWGDINVSANDLGFSNGLPITSAYFSLVGIGSQNSMRYQTWDFYSTINGVTRSIRFDIFYNTSSSNSIEGVSCITQINPPFDFILIFDNSYQFLYDPIIGNEYHNGYSQGQREGYNEGYNEGYDEGVDRGKEIAADPVSEIYQHTYETGYNVGYMHGAEGVSTDAFSVIGQAFGAVGYILNVQILPGLSLWVVLTAPLIIAIVIVVIKMIKG